MNNDSTVRFGNPIRRSTCLRLRRKLLSTLRLARAWHEPVGLLVEKPQVGRPQEEVEKPNDLRRNKGFLCFIMMRHHNEYLG
jgi:hypothetical protein